MANAMERCLKTMPCTTLLPTKTYHLKTENVRAQQAFIKARKFDKPNLNSRKLYKRGVSVLMSPMSNSDIGSDHISVSDTMEQFYACVNKKSLNQLSELISDDCSLDDCSYPSSFKGKKEVMNFFATLVASMGQNVQFNLGNICIGNELVAGVTWHLEWNKKRIPFTRGCSFCKYSMDGGRLVITKCLVMTESPMKPGGSALNLLKIVTTIFDKNPRAADWFLKSPQELLQLMIKIYSMVFRPFLSPFLAWYIYCGKLIGRVLSYFLNILIFISKFIL